jgi:hypothetical protein
MQWQTVRPKQNHGRVVALQVRSVQFSRVSASVSDLRGNFVGCLFGVRQVPKYFSLPFSVPVISDRKNFVFPAAHRDVALVNLNDRATDLYFFRELFMTFYDRQIALCCQILQAFFPRESLSS